MQRIGIYGGTYNPPHIGHMRAAAHGVKALELDKLLLVPSSISPHKELPEDSATAQERLEMLQMSARGIEKAQVSDIELQRSGASYTVDTVEQLHRENPDAELILMMGTDMFLSFLSWVRPERIMELATLAVFYRGEKREQESIEQHKRKLESMGAKVLLVENPVTAISSTNLRRMLVFRCADSFLCPGVGDYVRAHGLYHTDEDWKQLPMERLEQVVIELLNPNRVAHVLGCRDTAVDLAKHWGADQTDAARAGILHDITKAIDGPLQLTLCDEYGILLSKFSQENPKTLHALTGSLVADQIFGENAAVVEAIRYHTTGTEDMTLLDEIIWAADIIEPGRDHPAVEKHRSLLLTAKDQMTFEKGLLLVFNDNICYIQNSGQNLNPASLRARDALARKTNAKEIYMETLNKETILKLCKILYDKKAMDIRAIEVTDKTIIADWFIVASGRGVPQVKALCDELEDKAAEMGLFPRRKEGYQEGRWIVLDFGDLLVHLFHPEERTYYNLERLWDDGQNVITYTEEGEAK